MNKVVPILRIVFLQTLTIYSYSQSDVSIWDNYKLNLQQQNDGVGAYILHYSKVDIASNAVYRGRQYTQEHQHSHAQALRHQILIKVCNF